MEKYCVDCKNFKDLSGMMFGTEGYLCMRNGPISLITGESTTITNSCTEERSEKGTCKTAGLNFIAKY